MIIKKGTGVTVNDCRKGVFDGVAKRDFDTETEDFYPIVAAQIVYGMATTWLPGEEVPCRNSLCTIVPHELEQYKKDVDELEKRESKLKETENQK